MESGMVVPPRPLETRQSHTRPSWGPGEKQRSATPAADAIAVYRQDVSSAHEEQLEERRRRVRHANAAERAQFRARYDQLKQDLVELRDRREASTDQRMKSAFDQKFGRLLNVSHDTRQDRLTRVTRRNQNVNQRQKAGAVTLETLMRRQLLLDDEEQRIIEIEEELAALQEHDPQLVYSEAYYELDDEHGHGEQQHPHGSRRSTHDSHHGSHRSSGSHGPVDHYHDHHGHRHSHDHHDHVLAHSPAINTAQMRDNSVKRILSQQMRQDALIAQQQRLDESTSRPHSDATMMHALRTPMIGATHGHHNPSGNPQEPFRGVDGRPLSRGGPDEAGDGTTMDTTMPHQRRRSKTVAVLEQELLLARARTTSPTAEGAMFITQSPHRARSPQQQKRASSTHPLPPPGRVGGKNRAATPTAGGAERSRIPGMHANRGYAGDLPPLPLLGGGDGGGDGVGDPYPEVTRQAEAAESHHKRLYAKSGAVGGQPAVRPASVHARKAWVESREFLKRVTSSALKRHPQYRRGQERRTSAGVTSPVGPRGQPQGTKKQHLISTGGSFSRGGALVVAESPTESNTDASTQHGNRQRRDIDIPVGPTAGSRSPGTVTMRTKPLSDINYAFSRNYKRSQMEAAQEHAKHWLLEFGVFHPDANVVSQRDRMMQDEQSQQEEYYLSKQHQQGDGVGRDHDDLGGSGGDPEHRQRRRSSESRGGVQPLDADFFGKHAHMYERQPDEFAAAGEDDTPSQKRITRPQHHHQKSTSKNTSPVAAAGYLHSKRRGSRGGTSPTHSQQQQQHNRSTDDPFQVQDVSAAGADIADELFPTGKSGEKCVGADIGGSSSSSSRSMGDDVDVAAEEDDLAVPVPVPGPASDASTQPEEAPEEQEEEALDDLDAMYLDQERGFVANDLVDFVFAEVGMLENTLDADEEDDEDVLADWKYKPDVVEDDSTDVVRRPPPAPRNNSGDPDVDDVEDEDEYDDDDDMDNEVDDDDEYDDAVDDFDYE